MTIAPEGRPFIGGAVALTAGSLAVAWRLQGVWWLVFGVLGAVTVWIAAFFRNPSRSGPRGEHLVVAPADGRVVSIVAVDEPQFDFGRGQRVSIFMNVFNVHVNRYPITGAVEWYRYHPGKFVNATRDKASTDNEQATLGISGARGKVLVRQIAGFIARRIVTDARAGASARQGDRMGIIRFGSRVDTFLPPDSQVQVRVGDHIKAGVTILATWPT